MDDISSIDGGSQQRDCQPRTINVLLTSFAGLSLPRTTCIPFAATLPISSVSQAIFSRLPPLAHDLILTANDHTSLDLTSARPLSTLIPHDRHDDPKSSNNVDFLALHLNARLRGGKGGFGSQLRAAGGRMSSRKKRNGQQGDINGSNRNLDGRRLRTITEAKNLAEYLAVKPDMDRKEREERRRRWEAVVEVAERREGEMRDGKEKVRLDADWVDAKEEAEAKTREAVVAAMRAAAVGKGAATAGETGSTTSEGSESSRDAQSGAQSSSSRSSPDDTKAVKPAAQSKAFFGWDEDEEELSEDEVAEEVVDDHAGKGKGKGKAAAR